MSTTKWKTEMVKTSRGTFEVFVKGEGSPVCVTHHYSEFNHTGDHFAESFTGSNKVFLVNLREAGNSEKALEPYQIGMLEAVFDLEAIRQTLGYPSWTYAGHSTGGMIGVIYGILYSNALDSLILVGSAARDYFSSSPECIYNEAHPKFEKMQALIETLKNADLDPVERKQLAQERTKLSLYRPEKYEHYFSPSVHKKICAVRMNFFNRELHIFDVTRKLYRITARTLILCGRHDVQCPLAYSIEMNELISDSRLVVFDESNHYPFLEQVELYQQVVQDFLLALKNQEPDRNDDKTPQ